MHSYPSHVVLLHTGGLGDLVLSAALCESMASGNRTRVTLICRSHVAAATTLFPRPPDTVIPIDFNPHEWTEPTSELAMKLGVELQKIPQLRADLFLSIEHQPTWLAPIVAAHVDAVDSAYARLNRNAGWFARSVLRELGLTAVKVRTVETLPQEHETMRYARLAGKSETPPPRVWQIHTDAKQQAGTWLSASGFSFGRYIACFPGSAGTTPFKRFSLERFADAFSEVFREFEIPVLVIGNAGERRELEVLANLLESRGVGAKVAACEPGEVYLLAGLIRGALAFVGSETGLEHLAGALGIPGVTIFGGGTWPQYAPWALGSIGLVAPLKCFGCNWDCAFSFGLCVDSIESSDVSRALRSLLVSRHTGACVETIDRRSSAEKTIVERASATYRAAQRDRADRLTTILRLRDVQIRRPNAVGA